MGDSASLRVACRVSTYVTKLLTLSSEPGRAEKWSEFKFLYPKVVLTTERRI